MSREAGVAAAVLTLCSLQFVLAMRGAQIDPVLCLLTTFSVYAMLRHLLLGDGWSWYVFAGFAAGLGVITKGVGFLPMLLLIPFFALRAFRWKGLASLDAGAGRLALVAGAARDAGRHLAVVRSHARWQRPVDRPSTRRIATKSCSSRPSADMPRPGTT